MDFFYRVLEERKRLGLSQADAAAACGVSREMWGKYERGAASPGCDVMAAFSKTGADVLYILTGRREQPALEDIKTLTAAIEVIEEALAKRRATLPPAKKAEVIALAYDILKGDAQGQEKVERMLRLVA